MILRDPVHGLVAFEGWAERVVTTLLATREVQRLRRIRQLGLTSLVFPGAEHSRFSHALGTAHLMLRLQTRLRDRQGELPVEQHLDDEAAMDGLAAALLHDLGHGPFSHLFEEVVEGAPSHETWTTRILLDPGTDVHRALEELSEGMAERVAGLLAGKHRLRWLCRAVSGALDVDRSDYLLRDSHMTGVAYGLYDLDWLLEALTLAMHSSGEAVLAVDGRKGLAPLEAFFLARQLMYQQVYHHKATRAAECLIQGIFRRLAELIGEGKAPADTPRAMRAAVLGESIALGDYLSLEDATLLHSFASWEQSTDAELSDLAGRLRRRALPKTLPLPEDIANRPRWEEAKSLVDVIAEARGLRPSLHVFLDVPSSFPYEESEDGTDGLWVRIRHRPLGRPGDASFLLRQLRNQRTHRPRLIFHPSIRDDVERALSPRLSEPVPSTIG